MPLDSVPRTKWKFPRVEGIVVNEETGEWSDGAFHNELLREEDQVGPIWHQAEPEDWVEDIEAWERWRSYLDQPHAASNLFRVAVFSAELRIRSINNSEQ